MDDCIILKTLVDYQGTILIMKKLYSNHRTRNPLFLKIDKKKARPSSLYLETELRVKRYSNYVMYDSYERNPAALTFFWGLDARTY